MDYMDFQYVLTGGLVNLSKDTADKWRIETNITFPNGEDITLFLIRQDGKWYYSDEKCTLTYMNGVYELKSKDVTGCIQNVLKVYGFSISSGSILAPIPNEKVIKGRLFDFVMCIGQLANMYAFFETP